MQSGSIQETVVRLASWVRRAPKGFALVRFHSEHAAREVIQQLRDDLVDDPFPLEQIELPRGGDPTATIRGLIDRLRQLGSGVAMITGWAVLAQGDEAKRRLFSNLAFYREALAVPGVRQIWWMPSHLATQFLQAAPDLYSWFLVVVDLDEIPSRPASEGLLPQQREGKAVSVDDARRRAYSLADRAATALRQETPAQQIFDDLVFPAVDSLLDAGLTREAQALMDEWLGRLKTTAGFDPRTVESNDPRLATTLNKLAYLYNQGGRYAEAEPLYRQALEIDRRALGEDHPDFATSLNNLAALLRAQGRYAEAEPLFRQALEIRRTALGEDHPLFATSLNNLALLLDSQGRYAEAEPLYRQALEIRRTALGEDHPQFATNLNNLALLLKSQGRYAEAEPLYRQALEIHRTALGEDHPDFALSLHNLACLLWATERRTDAVPMMRRALEIKQNALGDEHPSTESSRGWLEDMEAGGSED